MEKMEANRIYGKGRVIQFDLFFGGASVFVCGRSNTTVLWGGGGVNVCLGAGNHFSKGD